MARLGLRQPLVVGLITGMIGVGPASAGEPWPVVAGPRVRVTAPAVSGKRFVGTLLAMDETTLTLRPQKGKDVLEVPRNAITRIELSRRPSRRGKGAGIGALVGLGAAVIIGLAAGDDCGSLPEPAPGWAGFTDALNRNLCMDKAETAVMSAILTVPTGALIGMAAAGGEKWVRTTPDRFSVAVKPVRTGGIGATVSVRF
jgi:hypothetical protein